MKKKKKVKVKYDLGHIYLLTGSVQQEVKSIEEAKFILDGIDGLPDEEKEKVFQKVRRYLVCL